MMVIFVLKMILVNRELVLVPIQLCVLLLFNVKIKEYVVPILENVLLQRTRLVLLVTMVMLVLQENNVMMDNVKGELTNVAGQTKDVVFA